MTDKKEQMFDDPPSNPMDALSDIEVSRSFGPGTVTLKPFNALDGWELKRQYRDYLASEDPHFRLTYTVNVLANTTIAISGENMPLNNPMIINQQLENWQNVEKVFLSALNFNGIKTDPADVERVRWQAGGEDLAKGFLAAVSDLMGPAFMLAARNQAEATSAAEKGSDAA
jgi:hypothetical protein